MRQRRAWLPGRTRYLGSGAIGRPAMKYVICTLLVVLGLGVFIACGDLPQPIICHDIPAGGCPSENGAACQDPTCTDAYLCNLADGTWVLDHPCPSHEGGVADAASDAAHEASMLPPRDASFDAPPGANGGPGCPPLEQPDCALGDGLACPSATGCCNCEDLYVCQSGGWNHWGACNPATGAITPDKK